MKPEQERNASIEKEEKVALCITLTEERKAEDILVLDLRDISSVTDYFFVCHGTSDRHVKAIADHVLEMMKKSGYQSLGVEGYPEARWILVDFGDLVIHIFYEETRRFYELERLWGHATQIYPPQEKAAY
jgi:ribosome-associated protein